ncbi:MAG: hypothetical protein CMJ78_26970 [Planctomycetaceae bacterium]|nr:hypothetical protein [Planctomycetaceae bacterium]
MWRQKNPDVLLDLSDADLQKANLRGANLRRANLVGANLSGANLIGANLTGADLTRANLTKAVLIKADFYTANLFKATMNNADLSGVYFRKTNLHGVNLSDTSLVKADFIEADLTNADLRNSTLFGADFGQSKLDGVHITGALLGWASFGNVNLAQVIGLDQIEHRGPTTIGLDTFFHSEGKISEDFLRGCGVPDGFLKGMANITGHPFEGTTCYIRFTKEESTFAERVFEALQNKGIRCWMDMKPEKPEQAKDVRLELPDDKVVLCASKYSLTSWWGEAELDRTNELETQIKKQTRKSAQILFPLNLDGFMFSGDWKYKNEKQIARISADFTGWRRNHTKFNEEIDKLAKGLKGN